MGSGLAGKWSVNATSSFGVDFFRKEEAKWQEKKKQCENKRSERPCWGRERQYLNPVVSDAVIQGSYLLSQG